MRRAVWVPGLHDDDDELGQHSSPSGTDTKLFCDCSNGPRPGHHRIFCFYFISIASLGGFCVLEEITHHEPNAAYGLLHSVSQARIDHTDTHLARLGTYLQ